MMVGYLALTACFANADEVRGSGATRSSEPTSATAAATNTDLVEEFVALMRARDSSERNVAVARCMIEDVQANDGHEVADMLVRAMRAQDLGKPRPPESTPALLISFQAAADCTARYDQAHPSVAAAAKVE